MLIFLQLYLAHLAADFLLQPDLIARNKRKPSALAAHAGIHVASACVVVNFGVNGRVLLTVVMASVIHVLLDYLKARLSDDGWLAFTVDQGAHLVVVALASMWLTASSWVGTVEVLRVAGQNKRLYLYLCAYVGVVFGGGYFVHKVTHSFLDKIQVNIAVLKPGLPNAGKYIGWVERFLILTFVIGGYGEAVGLLLAAKALARYPEIKEDTKGHFAEYFLIGTLTSVGLALIAGIGVKKIRAFLD